MRTITRCMIVSLSFLKRGTVAFATRHAAAAKEFPTHLHSITAPEDYNELPQDFPRRKDVLVALAAVRKACAVTSALQPESFKDDSVASISKDDLSPVSVGDFAAQAIVLRYLREEFTEDSFIAEESSQSLIQDEELANQVLEATSFENLELLKKSIDLGKEYEHWHDTGGRPARVWCLDPIDGTKGFLRGKRDGGQYCVALALLDKGEPVVGILGCPNLPASPTDFQYAWMEDETHENNQQSRGCIFVASKGGGAFQLPYVPGEKARRLNVSPNNDASVMEPHDARFCIGVENFSDPLGKVAGMASILHGEGALTNAGDIVKARRIDSQAKYGILARAGAEYYVRLPKPGYVEWIWDHAAGNVVITEAGGKMTDTQGQQIDFSLGAKFSEAVEGVLGSNGGQFHDALVAAFQQQEKERLKTK